MRYLLCAVAVCMTIGVVAAPPAKDAKQTEQEKDAKREAAKMRTGGLILDTREQKGKVVIVNGQKLASVSAIQAVAKDLADALKIRVEVIDGKPVNLDDAKGIKDSCGGNAAIILSDAAGQPPFIVAPDEAWSYVGVDAIKGGDVERRIKRQLCRAFSYACGCGSSDGLLEKINNPSDLEKPCDPQLAYSTTQSMMDYLKHIGVTPGRMVMYVRACREGWAPKPSNKYQESAWKRIHELPTEPIKIEYDPKKGE